MKEYEWDVRAHHGMCLAFFKGKGYSGAFVENMRRRKAGLMQNPLIRVIDGGDGICAACPNYQNGLCRDEEKVREYDRQVLARCGIAAGEVMPYADLERRVWENILTPGRRAQICGDCQWDALCNEKE